MTSVQGNPTPSTPVQGNKPNTIYLIRHGEKPKPSDVKAEREVVIKDADGNQASLKINDLTPSGWERAKELPVALTKLNIVPSYIIAQKADPPEDTTGDPSKRPEETVSWLKKAIPPANYDNKWTTNCFSDVASDAKTYAKVGNVLICWEHARLINVAQALGIKNPVPYPDDRYDLIWTVLKDADGGYTEIASITSEQTSLDTSREGHEWNPIKGTSGWEETDKLGAPVRKLVYEEDVDPDDKTKFISTWTQYDYIAGQYQVRATWKRAKGASVDVQWARMTWNDSDQKLELKTD